MNIDDLYREFVDTFTRRGAATIGKTKVVKLSGSDVGAGTLAYSAGDAIGTIITLSDVFINPSGQATLMGLSIGDANSQASDIEVLVFDSEPSPGTVTITDNTAVSLSTGALALSCGVVSVSSTDYKAYAANSIATVKNIGLPVWGTDGTRDLYIAIVSRGTPTYIADGLSISLTFYQDA